MAGYDFGCKYLVCTHKVINQRPAGLFMYQNRPNLAASNTKHMAKPLILVSNDDGITAPGIRTLVNVM
jgi:hypothetical protein